MILPDNFADEPQKFVVSAPIAAQEKLAGQIFRLTFDAPQIARLARPGQFVMVRAEQNSPVTLRRPLGIATADSATGRISLIYRVMGNGTAILSQLKKDDVINVLGPLGNGFAPSNGQVLLVGGGMGLSPLLFCAARKGLAADVLMGGKNAAEMFWPDLFSPYVKNIHITTDDGSVGEQGFTVSLLPRMLTQKKYDLVIAVGPEVMMRTAAKICREQGVPCQISLERRMACGLGACLSCSFDTTSGTRRKVCHDGPVFWAEEVYDA